MALREREAEHTRQCDIWYSAIDGSDQSCDCGGTVRLTTAERDALVAEVLAQREPKTCASCAHWSGGTWKTGDCAQKSAVRAMFTIYVYGDGRVSDYDFETPRDFGCTLYTPLPAAPKEPDHA